MRIKKTENFLMICLFIIVVNYFSTSGAIGSNKVQSSLVLTDRPIIGVLAQEVYDEKNSDHESFKPNNSYIAASYVKFLEGAGAQVVPIFINRNEAYLREIFSKLNGILIPGGSVPFKASMGTNGFVDAGLLFIKLAKEANDRGDYFPIWGTCLGFEFLVFEAAKVTEVTATCGAWNVRNKLKFTQEATESRIFGKAPKAIVKTLATADVTVNFHHKCVTPANFTKFGLEKEYRSLSLNYDSVSDLTYISSIEHRKYPFFGVQFHPEKNIYEWTSKEKIPHSTEAIQTAQYFATFFVNQARRNGHVFESVEEEFKYLIYNYCPVFTGAEGSTFTQKYFFPL